MSSWNAYLQIEWKLTSLLFSILYFWSRWRRWSHHWIACCLLSMTPDCPVVVSAKESDESLLFLLMPSRLSARHLWCWCFWHAELLFHSPCLLWSTWARQQCVFDGEVCQKQLQLLLGEQSCFAQSIRLAHPFWGVRRVLEDARGMKSHLLPSRHLHSWLFMETTNLRIQLWLGWCLCCWLDTSISDFV